MRSLLITGLAIFTLAVSGTAFAEDTPAKPAPNGRKIYKKNCGTCHNGGFKGWMTDAPETGEKDEWAKFFKKGADKMVENVITGKKKHPKKGDCKRCDEADIRAAVAYILKKTN